MPDLCPHDINWPGPEPKRERGKERPHPLGWQLLGVMGCEAFRTHQRVPLACSQRVRKKKQECGGGPRASPYGPPKYCGPCAGWKKNFQTQSVLDESEFIGNKEQSY